MDLIKIKQIAHDEMADKIHWSGEKGAKYYHGERVAELALTLKKYILPEDDGRHDDIIKAAGWFHDITNGMENHALTGAERTRILLAEHCSEYELREIYDIIYRHDDRTSDRNEFSVYAKIQQDADHLDHFGIFDIWMQFLCASLYKRTIVEDIENMKKRQKAYDRKKYEHELNFDVSKKIYRERIEFSRSFAERFEAEGTGGIWNENNIIN
jgi:uncharacterized protein